MGWLIALAVVVLLAALPLGVSICYNESGLTAKLIAGPLRMTVYPLKKKQPPREDQKQQQKPSARKAAIPTQPKQSKGGSLTDFLPLVQLLLDLLGDLRRKLRINRLEMTLIMAADDPCDLAIHYGRAWAAVGNLMPQLERLFVIKKKDVRLACDFEAEQTTVLARLDLTITLGRILSLVAVYALRAGKEFLKITNSRKGGAQI